MSAFVISAINVHRIPTRVRDVRETPLCGRDGGVIKVIWVGVKDKLRNTEIFICNSEINQDRHSGACAA
jgi:hypothetical protein